MLHTQQPKKKMNIKENTIELIDALKATEAMPTFIMGDFNAEPHFEEFAPIATRTDFKDVTAHIPVTYHGYFKEAEKIDYIFVNDMVKPIECDIWESPEGHICLSDHYPIGLICEI